MEKVSLDNNEEEQRARFRVLAEMREPFEGVSSEEIEREVAKLSQRSGGRNGSWQVGSFDDLERRSIVATKTGSNQTEQSAEIRDKVLPVLRRHGIKRAGMFGSCARGEATPESDVDILVELDKQASKPIRFHWD